MLEKDGIDEMVVTYDAPPEKHSSPTGKRKFIFKNTQKKKSKKLKIL